MVSGRSSQRGAASVRPAARPSTPGSAAAAAAAGRTSPVTPSVTKSPPRVLICETNSHTHGAALGFYATSFSVMKKNACASEDCVLGRALRFYVHISLAKNTNAKKTGRQEFLSV